jgi:SAM-dependent methyltransferase
VPCGDGFFTALLARRMYPFGKVTAADRSDAYLTAARRSVAGLDRAATVDFVKSDAYQLPFDDSSFDVVWCAQSFISIGDPVAALREMRRVIRSGGRVAVLEDDDLHRVVLNWPVGLELDVRRAMAEVSRERYGARAALSPGRRVREFFRNAGLEPLGKKTIVADRQVPFDPAVRRFLRLFSRDTRASLAGHLAPEQFAAVARATDPDDPGFILNCPDAGLTYLTTLFLAGR